MPFWRCYYHIVWATKNREPVITVGTERILFEAIGAKSEALKCSMLAVNGAADHIHIAVAMPPTIAIVDRVKHVKGVSSREVNAALSEPMARFRWQESYGVHTFGAKNLSFVLDYIARQKEHHANGTAEPYLEQIDEPD